MTPPVPPVWKSRLLFIMYKHGSILIFCPQARQQAQLRHQMAEDSKADYSSILQKFNHEQHEYYHTHIPNIFQVSCSDLSDLLCVETRCIRSSLVAQRVKGLVVSLLWQRLNPWPQEPPHAVDTAKNKNKNKTQQRTICLIGVWERQFQIINS